MTLQVIPLQPVRAQLVNSLLSSQPCQIVMLQKSTGMFISLYVNSSLIIGGVICQNRNLIVRDAYLGFLGDLAFYDTAGTDDPIYTGLGSRFVLLYLYPGAPSPS